MLAVILYLILFGYQVHLTTKYHNKKMFTTKKMILILVFLNVLNSCSPWIGGRSTLVTLFLLSDIVIFCWEMKRTKEFRKLKKQILSKAKQVAKREGIPVKIKIHESYEGTAYYNRRTGRIGFGAKDVQEVLKEGFGFKTLEEAVEVIFLHELGHKQDPNLKEGNKRLIELKKELKKIKENNNIAKALEILREIGEIEMKQESYAWEQAEKRIPPDFDMEVFNKYKEYSLGTYEKTIEFRKIQATMGTLMRWMQLYEKIRTSA